MSLIGKSLAHYSVTAEIGKGGMGEVYQAKDTKLGRDVAIKVLPEEFAKDADRIARFQREAKLLASLNHPNIAAIYGLEESDGTNFLVMELVEGQTLADRIMAGAIPVEESLKLALQITEALEAAHEKAVIHRDLKPANIKITPEGKIKVLDFGLAKAFTGEQADLNLSNSPTLSQAATMQGVILGTAAYMSPEQASGETVDKRADVWAFGVVLFEMLTGRSLFEGNNISQTLARVLERQPDFSALPRNLHPKITELLDRCLEKEAKNRYGSISDARVDVQKVLADPAGAFVQKEGSISLQKKLGSMLPWLAATLILGAVIAGFAVWKIKSADSSSPPKVVRLEYNLPAEHRFSNIAQPMLAVSPDSTQFIYCTTDGIYLRPIDKDEAKIIPGTKGGAYSPFFSPDGKRIGYYSADDKKLRTISINGGSPNDLCEIDSVPVIPRWSTDGNIVYGEPGKGIMQIYQEGGTPEPLLKDEQLRILFPQVLPDGKAVLFSQDNIVVVEKLESEQPIPLFPGNSPRYLHETGHILYSYENALFVRPFNLDNFEYGDDQKVFEGVYQGVMSAQYAVSDTGTIIYIPESPWSEQFKLVWVDMNGKEEDLNLLPKDYRGITISPDGRKIAYVIQNGDTSDLFTYDLVQERESQLTENKFCQCPIWSPNGERLYFTLTENEVENPSLCWLAADSGGDINVVSVLRSGFFISQSWTSSGKELVGSNATGFAQFDIGMVPVEGNSEYVQLWNESNIDSKPKISSDGLWMAYESWESGSPKIIVRSFPDLKNRHWILTEGGGQNPLWLPSPPSSPSKLFYMGRDSSKIKLMSVSFEAEPNFQPTKTDVLFDGFYRSYLVVDGNSWDIHPDGKKFLMMKPIAKEGSEISSHIPSIKVALNWLENLKQREPVN